MSDDVWRPRLSEHLDGELTAEEMATLTMHLESCAPCRADVEGLRKVVARIDAAPDLGPATDLWPAIARRRGSGGAAALWRLAAGLAAVGLMAFAAWSWRDLRPGGGNAGREEAYAGDAAGRYGEAAAAWQEALAGRTLPPEVAAAVQAEMDALDRAVRETRGALDRHPDDAGLRAHLAATLRAQARFLSRVEEIAGEAS